MARGGGDERGMSWIIEWIHLESMDVFIIVDVDVGCGCARLA